MQVQFGTVLHARFKLENGQILSGDFDKMWAANRVLDRQQLHDDGIRLNNTERLLPYPVDQSGNATDEYYFVMNGPQDTDGTEYIQGSRAILDETGERLHEQQGKLTPLQRAFWDASQRRLNEQFVVKAERRQMDIIVKDDGTYEKGEITPLNA